MINQLQTDLREKERTMMLKDQVDACSLKGKEEEMNVNRNVGDEQSTP